MKFRPIRDGKDVAAWVRKLKGKSGVYLIREKSDWLPEMLYVGESHSGRLPSTILRHFQRWKGPTAGPTFDPSLVEVAAIITPAKDAVDRQNALIAELSPKHNITGKEGWWETLFK
jgi:hypothetical protein